MKVYVENEDIPKRCAECRFCYYNEDEYLHCCRINGVDIENKKCWREVHKDCPLLSISDYTKQVRKEVCEEIKKWCDKNFNWVGDGVGYDGQDYNEMIGSNNTINKLRKFLDQIQGETK